MKVNLILLLILLLISCKKGNPGKELNDQQILLLKDEDKTVKLSELFSEINYVPLQTTKKSFIGEIIHIKLFDKTYYILNQAGENSNIKTFSYNGKYLGTVGNTGAGAKEIFKPRDFVLNRDVLYVWDNKGIHSFSRNGNYLKFMLKAHFVGRIFFYSEKSFFFLHELNPPGFLSKYDVKGNLEKVFIPFDLWLGAFEHAKIIEIKESFHIFSPVVDTIYSYSNDNLIPKYFIQCNSAKSLGKLFLDNKNLNPYELSKVINKTPHFNITHYNENENYIYMSYLINRKKNMLLINKNTWNQLHFSDYINDFDHGLFGDAVLLTDDDQLVVPLHSYELLDYFKKNKNLTVPGPFWSLANRISLNNNPVLMICKLEFK